MLILPSTVLFGTVILVLIAVREILLPFILAIFLAYLIYPVVRFLHRLHIGRLRVPRWLGVILVYAVVLGGGIPLAVTGVGSLSGQISTLSTSPGATSNRVFASIRVTRPPRVSRLRPGSPGSPPASP